MLGSSRRYVAIALFTALVILLVNFSWWAYYSKTERALENSLSRRLVTIALSASTALNSDDLERLKSGSLAAGARIDAYLERFREVDSVGEIFILNENYRFLATSNPEPDSIYLLSDLNGAYIDSVFFRQTFRAITTPTYPSGELYLKSAYAPLVDSSGLVTAVLGVEASVDYFDSLADLRRDLYYATGFSVAGGFVLGLLFLLLQRSLNRAEQQLYLGETQRHLGRMVAVVAHEIRNPLMIVRASGERLLKKYQAEEAGYIVEETDRLNQIVSGYLEFASAEGSLLAGETPETFDLIELVQSIRKHFTQRYASNSVDWLGSLPQRLEISGYRRSLRQVLLNLLINGADACVAAGKPVAAGIRLEETSSSVQITVFDHGPGIPKKELKKLFTPFYTTKQSGSGLGLYLSRQLVTEMGGVLDIKSIPGEGTELILQLPKRTRN
ncbi:MAG: HAMP domain-containing sensor histidine kinase [Candidatus Zixiibacteriota bacterium]